MPGLFDVPVIHEVLTYSIHPRSYMLQVQIYKLFLYGYQRIK